MNPEDYTIITTVQTWFKAETDKRHSMAVKYIEENVDLIETDLQKFMDDCPSSCQLEVCEMLLKAGIDMQDYAINNSLKKWDNYVHSTSPRFKQYYTIDYKQQLDEFILKTVTEKTDWRSDCIVLDTIPEIEEVNHYD